VAQLGLVEINGKITCDPELSDRNQGKKEKYDESDKYPSDLQNRLIYIDNERDREALLTKSYSKPGATDECPKNSNRDSQSSLNPSKPQTPIYNPNNDSHDGSLEKRHRKIARKTGVPVFKRSTKAPIIQEMYKELDELGLDYTESIPTFRYQNFP
jgi:hypothetical protein